MVLQPFTEAIRSPTFAALFDAFIEVHRALLQVVTFGCFHTGCLTL